MHILLLTTAWLLAFDEMRWSARFRIRTSPFPDAPPTVTLANVRRLFISPPADHERYLTDVVERSLLSLLLVPLVALIFLLVWKVSRYPGVTQRPPDSNLQLAATLNPPHNIQNPVLCLSAHVQVRSRRTEGDLEQNSAEGELFAGTEGTAPPPPHPDVSEK